MKNLIPLILVVMLFSGCASVKTTEPVQRKIEKSRTYNMTFDKTWNRAVDWFADNNIQIDKIEKTSGLISAKYLLPVAGREVDCGKIDASGIIGRADIARYGAINITVREVSETTTKVNVNFFGRFNLLARDLWDGRRVEHNGNCVSVGRVEKSILNFIGNE